jgi:hypothetical protein
MLIKIILLLLPCLTVLPISPATQQPSKLELPPQARDALYLKFPDWRYADVSDEVRQALKHDGAANIRPDLITGDFDGDGRADYAALIFHGTTRVEQNEVVGPDFKLVIFMARDQSYQLQVIEDPGGEYIELIHKGDRLYDYEAQKEFTLEHDAIDAIIFEKGATSYVYENGGFRAIITGD